MFQHTQVTVDNMYKLSCLGTSVYTKGGRMIWNTVQQFLNFLKSQKYMLYPNVDLI
jgi:hypothetical protein